MLGTKKGSYSVCPAPLVAKEALSIQTSVYATSVEPSTGLGDQEGFFQLAAESQSSFSRALSCAASKILSKKSCLAWAFK